MKMRHQIVVLIGLLLAGCGGSDFSPAPANQAPTISAVPDQSTVANATSAAIGFTVTDEQASALSITASSDRAQVVPDSSLELGGSGTDRILTVTPVFDTLGDAFISIVVTDTQGLSANTSFLLTVDPLLESMQQFTRNTFAELADDDPEFVNAVNFTQDADDDDFADLFAQ